MFRGFLEVLEVGGRTVGGGAITRRSTPRIVTGTNSPGLISVFLINFTQFPSFPLPFSQGHDQFSLPPSFEEEEVSESIFF